jgi:hypothetical protein
MFRKNRKALEERLESAKEKSVEDKLKEEIRNVK